MRKRYRVLILAALVAALGVPVGYALSIDTTPKIRHAQYGAMVPGAATVVASAVMMRRAGDAVPNTLISPVAESAKLLCIGTVLFGLAAAVRRAI